MSQPKPADTNQKTKLPKDFLWGTATSSHQVEGHQHNDWSVWEARVAEKLAEGAEARLKNVVPGWDAIKREATDPANYISGEADDHYNRYEEDFDIMQSLGINAYRFSIEWSRIEPEPGKYDNAALEHYAAMVAALKKRGITPLVTLHHFTNPIWLEDHGGWHGREVVERFTKYCEVVVKRLGEEVDYWCTINEPGSYLVMRYLGGGAWPEWPIIEMNPLHGFRYVRNLVMAHKIAYSVIKSAKPGAQVALVSATVFDFQLGRKDLISWLAKKLADYFPDKYILNRVRNYMDFLGITYYMRSKIKAGLSQPQNWAPKCNDNDTQNDMGWGIYPKGLYNVTQRAKHYGLPMYVLENGIPDAKDIKRADFINEHVKSIVQSTDDGADIRGYFYWSLLDNYEWSEGFWPKFGLVAVDRKTQKRTIRPSAYEYAKLIKKYRS